MDGRTQQNRERLSRLQNAHAAYFGRLRSCSLLMRVFLLLLRTAPLPKRSFGRAIYWGEPRRLTYARVKLGHGKWLALPLPLRLVDRVANEVSTHVGWALLPVQVTDVGQEWPTDSKIDSPAANGRGSQDVTNAALQRCTTSAPGGASRFGPGVRHGIERLTLPSITF
jgi:hypothetical protein